VQGCWLLNVKVTCVSEKYEEQFIMPVLDEQSLSSFVNMAQHGAALQTCNLELVKGG
jgi:hypothetical protein